MSNDNEKSNKSSENDNESNELNLKMSQMTLDIVLFPI